MAELKRAGFARRGGKGSHLNFKHPSGVRLTLSGKPGDAAELHQERDVQEAIEEAGS